MQLVLLSGNRVGNIKRKLLMLSLPLTLIHGEKCSCVYCLHLNSKIYVENLIKAHSLIMHHASLLTFVSCVDFYNTGNGRRGLTLISEPIFKIYMLHLSIGKVKECCLRSEILQRKKKKNCLPMAGGINGDQCLPLCVFFSSSRNTQPCIRVALQLLGTQRIGHEVADL